MLPGPEDVPDETNSRPPQVLGSVATYADCTNRSGDANRAAAQERETIMNGISRFATTLLVSGGLGLAGLGLGADIALADSPAGGYTWCPGQTLPFGGLRWDMSVCHTYYFVPFGQGNVVMADLQGNLQDSYVWADSLPPPTGPPPPLPPRPSYCPPWNVIIGPSECGGL